MKTCFLARRSQAVQNYFKSMLNLLSGKPELWVKHFWNLVLRASHMKDRASPSRAMLGWGICASWGAHMIMAGSERQVWVGKDKWGRWVEGTVLGTRLETHLWKEESSLRNTLWVWDTNTGSGKSLRDCILMVPVLEQKSSEKPEQGIWVSSAWKRESSGETLLQPFSSWRRLQKGWRGTF